MSHEALPQNWTAFHTTETERREWAPGYEPPKPRSLLLDKPTEPHPILSLLMDEALCRIMLVSDGAVMALRERTTGSRAPSAPTSHLAAAIDRLGERFSACKTHRKRLVVIKEAQDTADNLRYAPKGNVVGRGTKEWRKQLATDPRPQRVVAADYRVSSKTITAARKEFKATVA